MANRTVSVELVARIGGYVSGMTQAAAATRGLGDSVDDTTRRTRGGFDIAGKGALLMGGAVVAGLGLAVAKSMEFESAMSAAAAGTQATGAALGDLRDAAMEAGAATQYSATEAAQAITEMGKAGVSTADILDGGLNGALSLAAAGQLDVAKAAEIASVAMTQFKLSGDELPHVADLLAAGAGKAMGSVEDLGMALNQAGLVASASGLNIEETTGTLAAFASAGLIGSDAGTSLKTMLQKLQAPSKEAAATMSDLGINMYDANGNFAGMDSLAGQLKTGMANLTPAVRDAAMATIFGSDAVRAANVLYSQGAEGIAEWTAKVNDQGYAAKQAAALNDNLAGDLERLGGSFDTLMISMGSGAQGPLRELTQGLTGLLDGVGAAVEWFSDLPGPVKATAIAFLAVHLINGPLAGTLAMVSARLSTVAAGAVGATASLLTLRGAGAGAMAALGGPAGLAVLAIGGLVTAMELASPPIEIVEANVGKLNTALERFGRTGDVSGEMTRMFGDLDGVIADLNAVPPAVSGMVDKWLYSMDVINATGKLDLREWLIGDGNSSADFDRMQADFEQAQQDVEDLDNTLAGMVTGGQAEAAARATMRLYDAWVKSGGEIGEFRRKFPEAVAAMEGYALTSQTVVSSTGEITTGLGEAKSASDLLKASFDALNGIYISAADANIRWTQTMDDLKVAAENGSTSLDLNTIAGADNAAQFTAAALQARDWAAAVGDTSGPEAGRAKLAELRQALIDNAVSTGFNRDQVTTLIDELFRVPDSVESAANLQDNATPGLNAVNGALDAIDGKTATVYVTTVTSQIVNRILNATPINEVGSGGNPIGLPPIRGPRAKGGTVLPGTWLVGEEGPELLTLGSGQRGMVYSAPETRSMLSGRESSAAPTFRSREFSGGGYGGGGGSVSAPHVATVNGQVFNGQVIITDTEAMAAKSYRQASMASARFT